jgi:hypothetical protein
VICGDVQQFILLLKPYFGLLLTAKLMLKVLEEKENTHRDIEGRHTERWRYR